MKGRPGDRLGATADGNYISYKERKVNRAGSGYTLFMLAVVRDMRDRDETPSRQRKTRHP